MAELKRHTSTEQESPISKRSSRIVVPAGIGDVLLQIMEEMQPLLTAPKMSLGLIEEKAVDLCKSLTGATWVEVLVEENDSLRILGKLQNVSTLELDDSSLPSYTATHGIPQLINNPMTSTLYTSFPNKLHPYSNLSKQRLKASNIACVPIFDEEKCRAVLLMFNKVDENKMFSFFNENDIGVIQSIGIALISALQRLSSNEKAHRKVEMLKRQISEEQRVNQIQVQSLVRKQLLECFKQLITKHSVVTVDIVRVISDVMEAQGIIFHLMIYDRLMPLIESGMSYTNTNQLFTKTAEFVAYNSKEILNVEELVSEPLWENHKIFKGRGLLSCPIFGENGEVIGVVEFFRTNETFSAFDRSMAEEMVDKLKNISTERCFPTVKNLDIPESPIKPRTMEQIYHQVSSLYTFSLSDTELYDYVAVMEEIQNRIKNTIGIENCTVYIADQKLNMLWTKKSDNCDPLVYPLGPDTLFGVCFRRQEMIEYPEPGLAVSDFRSFEEQNLLCLPLTSRNIVSGVIGLLVLNKQQQEFTNFDRRNAKFFAPLVTQLLETWFIHSLKIAETETPNIHFPAQETNFREANKYYQNSSFRKLSTRMSSAGTEPVRSKPLQESMSYALSLASIPQNRLFEVKRIFNDIAAAPEDTLKILAHRISQLIPCQKAGLLMIDNADQHIYDISSEKLLKASGLIHRCILKKQIISIRADVMNNTYFDPHIDSLGLEQRIDNFLAVPIFSLIDTVLGVFVFVNASISFGDEDIALVQFLSLLPREFVFTKDENMKNFQAILKTGRRHKMLQHWCKQIFFVANSTQQSMSLAQNILHRLFGNEDDLGVLIQASLELISVTLNAERASLVHKEGNEFFELTLANGTIFKSPVKKDDELLMKAIDTERPVSDYSNKSNYENLLIVPLVLGKKRIFALKAQDKRDDSLTYYCNFTKSDELVLTDFIKALAAAHEPSADWQSYESLVSLIRQRSSSMNTYTLISTIRTAAQKLLDCDRATVFIKEGKHMVVKAQGIENEIPGGFSVPIGKGIIGNVAQTAQVENIPDVYSDPRFNTEVDKRTGYKTSNMLCMPVLDTNNKVIAALQMINKRQGCFEASDEETLEIFCEIISTVLKNWNTFQKNIEEKNRYLNILNSVGTYILVFSDEGKLVYSNKAIYDIFGVDELAAKQSHYSSWLRTNRQLVYDITSVQQRQHKKIYRTAQKINILTLKHTRSNITVLRSFNFLGDKEMIFNYTVASLQDYFNIDRFGIVLILEDATNIEELNMKFSKIQEELQAIKNPVHTETPLQKCIGKLQMIESSSQNPELKGQIQEIINTLKQGNLHKIEVTFSDDISSISDQLKNALAEYTELDSPDKPRASMPPERKVSRGLDVENLGTIISELRELNLNVFEIQDQFRYVSSMLHDFDLINQFNIESNVLEAFVGEVRDQYEVWNNPYHNFVHGFNVMHVTYLLLVSTPADTIYCAHDILALLIASLCHDIQHTGRTNAFEINRMSHLAVIYNDQSVLENHHAAMTFKILQNDKTNILASLSPSTMKSVRKMMIDSILATDMAKHFQIVGETSARLKDMPEQPIGSKDNDAKSFAGLLVHSADLGHPCTRLDIYKSWSARVCEEFGKQYSEELELGLPPTELMKDVHKPDVYYDKEHGFLKFIVLPLWNVMEMWLHPHVSQFMEQLNYNIDEFARMKEKYKQQE